MSYGDNIAGISIGGAKVSWNDNELGYLSEEGCKLILPGAAQPITIGDLGDTVVDEIDKGGNVKVILTFEQFNLDLLKSASPKLAQLAQPGTLYYQYAKELVIHPRHKGSGDTTEDIVLNKTISHADIEIISQLLKQKQTPVEFIAFPDRSKAVGQQWGKIWNYEF